MPNQRVDREIRVTFDAETIKLYGGQGSGFHASEEMARQRGYPGLVSWGSLTLLPFWELMALVAGENWQIGGRLSVKLAKPVLAGDEVVYEASLLDASPAAQNGDVYELSATTIRNGIVAKGQAIIGLADGEQQPREGL